MPATTPDRPAPGPAPGRGREPLRGLTVLYDPYCRVCRFVADWLTGQRKLVPVRLVPVGSEQARRLFPELDHERTRRDITVVGDAGQVYVGQTAWVVVLWALADHRALAHRMSTPAGRRLARAAVLGVAKYRESQDGARGARPSRPVRPGAASVGTGSRAAPPRGAPLAGRRREPPVWVYDGRSGWTATGAGPFAGTPAASPAPAGDGCAEGCSARD